MASSNADQDREVTKQLEAAIWLKRGVKGVVGSHAAPLRHPSSCLFGDHGLEKQLATDQKLQHLAALP